MATFNWTDEEIQRSTSVSGVNTQREYMSGTMGALASEMNMVAGLNRRGEYVNADVDTSGLESIEFTRPNLRAQLSERGFADNVVDRVMGSYTEDWASALRKAEYFKRVEDDRENINNELSTTERLLYGLPMAIVDADTLVLGPLYKGVSAGVKSANLATKMGVKASGVTAGAVTGGLAGAGSMGLYELATDVYDNNSLINASLMGMALGGSLGFFAARAPQQDLTRTSDAAGNPLNRESAKIEQIANARMQNFEMGKLIEEVENLQARSRIVEDAAKGSKKADRATLEADLAKANREVNNAQKAAKSVLEGVKNARRTTQTLIDNSAKNIRKLEKELKASSKADNDLALIKQERNKLSTGAGGLKGNLSKLRKKLDGMKGVRDPVTRKELNAKIKDMEMRIAREEAKIARLDSKAAKLNVLDPKIRSVKDMELQQQRQVNYNAMSDLEKVNKELPEAQKKFVEARQYRKDQGKRNKLARMGLTPSKQTAELEARLKALGADLTPEGIRKLAEKRGIVEEDLAKMMGDDFRGLRDLYGIKKEKVNYINKLNDELNDVGKPEKFTESKAFKALPEFAKKLMISPIEKVLASENEFVRGLAMKLHAGTVHHGKANTMNAWNFKRNLDAQQNWMMKEVTHWWQQALKEGTFTGTRDEWLEAVAQESYRSNGALQRQIWGMADGAMDYAERIALANQRAGGIQRQFTTSDKNLQKAVEAHVGYYEKMHKMGNELGMEGFKGSLGRGYIKRMYSESKIKQMGRENAIEKIFVAQEKYAIDNNKAWGAEEIADARAKAAKAVDETLSREYKIKQVTDALGSRQPASTSSFKQRGIEAYDDDLMEVLSDNIEGTTLVYGMGTHGRMALQKALGVYKDDAIEDLLKAAGAQGGDLDRLRGIIDTIKGTREIDKNPWNPISRGIKFASTYTSAMHTMAFALPTMTETASIAKEFGWGRTIDNLVGNPKEIYNLYRKGGVQEKNTVHGMISYGDAFFNHKVNRMDVDTGFDSVGKTQEFMDGVVQKMAVYGGLLPITDMLKMTTASLSVDFLARMSAKQNISKADMKRVLDMGFDADDLTRIRTTLKVDKDGMVGNWDRKTWGQLDERITMGVQTMVERTILEPNGATLPMFMTDMRGGGVVPRIFMKFMRFPVESYERMLVRGIQEADAKQALGLAGNIAMWSAILAMKDAVREEDKQQYTGDDGMTKLMRDSFMYNSWTGGIQAMADTATGFATGENLTNDYRYRMGGAVQSHIENFQKGEPKVNVPFKTINIGEAFSNAMQAMGLMEETNK